MKIKKNYFLEMFKNIDDSIQLDDQQIEAITMNADNLLVVAGAGSGKTTTMVAKVKYLIDCCNYREKDIVVLSFTKKVAEEITDILHNKFNLKGVEVTTFHKLGLRIINKSGENVEGIVDENGQYKIFSEYIINVLFNDKNKFSCFIEAFSKYLYFGDDWRKHNNFIEFHREDYKNQFIKSGFNLKKYIEDQIIRRRNYKKTISGEYLASKEEVDIANFLFKNSIKYEYEKKFDNKRDNLINYHPDFYIHQLEKENYIEHFGVDQDGHNGMYTQVELSNYLKALKIKQSFFEQDYNKELFIVTYSKYDNDKNYISDLNEQLVKKGYTLISKTNEQIYEELEKTSHDKYFAQFIQKLLIPFISLFKQQGYIYEDFNRLIDENAGDLKNQLTVLRDFYSYYEEKLKKIRKIDFEDMIIKSYNAMKLVKEKSLGVDYKYLIIDEYQDISNQRLNLVKRLSQLFAAKVMAVGDDWQTIFGYAGSRIDLFTNFCEGMTNAKQVKIENTYRNSQELIDVAGKFILKNRFQIYKKLKSKKKLLNPVEILFYSADKGVVNANRAKVVDKVISKIYRENKKNQILLLGRYKKDIYKLDDPNYFKIMGNKIISVNYPSAKMEFLTIHKAKGLGRDYAILIDLNDDKYGFPSKIDSFPIIQLITPKIDEPINYPEERRLFYVALTRTKNKVFILVPDHKKSEFAIEIASFENVRLHDELLQKV